MNKLIWILTNLLFSLPLAIQKALYWRIDNFKLWFDKQNWKVQYAVRFYFYLSIFTYSYIFYIKWNYGYFHPESDITPREEIYACLANHFFSNEIYFNKFHFLIQLLKNLSINNLEFFKLKILFLLIFFLFFKRIYYNIIIKFIFLLNCNLFISTVTADFDPNLILDFVKFDVFNNKFCDENLELWGNKYAYIKDNFDIYGIQFYNKLSVSSIFEHAIINNKFLDLTYLFLNLPLDFNIKNVFLEEFFILNTITFFFKKKIIFFLLNLIILILMLFNLSNLYKSINLIYALLHFLMFAVLSGILILAWGNSYIAFCVLLIYGAAIPVLALYIIMLVNVDLIQRLFFNEYLASTHTIEKRKKFILLLFIFFYFIFSLRNINYSLTTIEYPWLNEIYKNIFFSILTEKYFSSIQFSYGYTNIYDLVLSFYSSDIDKVASTAFKTSFNELLALVFLLLIAIIVVISISRPDTKKKWFVYERIVPDFTKFYKFFDHMTLKVIKHFEYMETVNKFLISWAFLNFQEFHGNRLNSMHDPIYLKHHYRTRFGFVGLDNRNRKGVDMDGRLVVDPSPSNPNDPWTEWFKVYGNARFIDYLEGNRNVQKFLGKNSPIKRQIFSNEETMIYKATHRVYL